MKTTIYFKAILVNLFLLSCSTHKNTVEPNFNNSSSASTSGSNFCEVLNPLTDLPWLKKLVDEIKNSSNGGTITKFKFKSKDVFLVNTCKVCITDAMTVLYDCAGNQICSIGGIAGLTCPDFEKEASDSVVVFSK
jgi:hypothetical protein